MATTGTWRRIYDGGDIGAIVRGTGNNPFDSQNVSLTHLFDNMDDVFTRSEISVEHKPTCFSATADSMLSSAKKQRQACEKIVPFSLTHMKHDPDSAENVSSTASSPRPSVYQKCLPRSPTRESRESMGLDNSSPKEAAQVHCTSSAIKTEADDQSPTKMCSLPKVAGTKRRKNQQKSIVCIPMAEGSWNKQGGAGVASDLWSWRKYGQKPIKGSPYPRGYYRCSSSKGCPARKQVERSRTDPTMLVITYTADHNHASPAHRRALARSSGQNSLHDKKEQPLSLSVPHTSRSDAATATDNHHVLSPPDESAQQERGPDSECVDNSLDDNHQFLSGNHMLHEDFFTSFGEFPALFHKDFSNRSDEEDDCTMVDPFNLFDWSFPTNEWPNS